ncbi:aldehyde dehydrogenase family protein [Sphingomonas sp.]|uniref:aldehyde dehydrogenase family protein n=1 Tax=Sphingomonas sp. TaxID=28214 RepID=UPI003D6C7349
MAAAINLTIGGASVAGLASFDVIDPATGKVAGLCPAATAAEVDSAVAAAGAAFATWQTRPDAERKAACHAIADVLERHAEELAQLLTLEQGKPLNGLGSRYELQGAIGWARYTADLDLPIEILQDDAQARIELHRRPLGVVASITPWNWPLMIAIWHIVPAIRTGNTVVIKPSPYTPLSTLRMVELLREVLPSGVLNAIAGPDDLGPLLTGHPGVAKVIFTGSTATGKKVMTNAADTLKRLTLELGGNDAGIVLPDADPDAIAEGLFWGAFINNGQTCAALKRLYVHDSIYEGVAAALLRVAAGVTVGPGRDEASILGPVQNRMQRDRVAGLVDQARAAGARILTGGERPGGDGYFYPITLIADATDGMSVVDQEQFGPVLPIIRYSDVEQAIASANASESGLGGSIWSSNLTLARELAQRLECGTAWINKHGAIQPNAPFGGIKSSGIGVEFARQGLEEYTTIQVVHQ